MNKADKESITGEHLRSLVIDYLKSAKLKALDSGISDISEYLVEWSLFVDKKILSYKLKPFGELFILDIINNPNSSIEYNFNDDTTTSTLDITVLTLQEFRKDFLERIYQGSDLVKNLAVKLVNYNFRKAFIFNNDTGTLTSTVEELNQNIKQYQEELFNTLFTYLQKYYNIKKNLLSTLEYSIFENQLTLYKDGKYTGSFEQIFKYSSLIFDSYDSKRLNTEYTLNTPALKAFNAFQTLLHFDEFLINTFGEAIAIKDMNTRFQDSDKYSLNSKATAMFWSNLKDDDINVEKSTNNVSKLIIGTTRLHSYKTGEVIPDAYLSTNLFISTICKIKDLSWNRPLSEEIDFNRKNSRNKNEYDLSDLSALSLKFITEFLPRKYRAATLASIIVELRRHPRIAHTALFEILTSEKLKPTLSKVMKEFTIEEQNVIMSLGKELFNNSNNSLRLVLDNYGYQNSDYFSYLLQTSDSTWSVKNCQYYSDIDSGKTYLRSLKSSNIANILRDINDTLNIINSPTVNKVYLHTNARYDNNGFHFVLKYDNGEHHVNINNIGKVTIDGKELPDNRKDLGLLLPFISHMFGEDLSDTSKLFKNISDLYGDEKLAIQNLFNFAAELLHGQFTIASINSQIKSDTSGRSKSAIIEEAAKTYYPLDYYGEPRIKFDYGNIDIVPRKQVSTLSMYANAVSITQGITSASQVNDSNGNAIATSTPSRLESCVLLQFSRIRSNPNSAARDFSIVKDPRTLIDILTVREFNGTDTKTYNQFNTREFLESSILYDFIMPIINPSGNLYDLTASGIGITPTVNSDKNSIFKLIIDLKHDLEMMLYHESLGILDEEDSKSFDNSFGYLLDDLGRVDLLKFIVSDNNLILNDEIDNLLGTYYEKLYNKITKDLFKLSDSLTWKSILGEFILDYTPESFKEFNSRLAAFNILRQLNELPTVSIRQLLDAASRETGVQINEQLHVIVTKKGLQLNNSLLSLYARHNNRLDLMSKYFIPSTNEFWGYKNSELLYSLVTNKVTIPVSAELENILDKSWINDSGNLVLAKYNGVPISSEKDIINVLRNKKFEGTYKNNPYQLIDGLILNPILDNFNKVSYFYSLQYLLSTVGSHINHPNKKAEAEITNIELYLIDEANRYLAQHKRNVSQTASMHEFLLNLLKGIPSRYNIAVIEDIKDLVYNIAGVLDTAKPFDGATIVNPFTVILENNSLNGEKAGIHKKLFVHFYDEELGTGGIIKTAGFGITNSWMNAASPLLHRMFRNMCDIPWTLKDGTPTYIDITKDILNSNRANLVLYDIYYTVPIKNSEGKLVNTYKLVTDIKYLENGNYEVKVVPVSKTGVVLGPEDTVYYNNVNSNYKLWQMFGGLHSASFNENGELSTKGKYGESSIYNVVKAMNNCGFSLDNNAPADLENYYLPMKHSDTHYAVTEGAIKLGTANFNLSQSYYEDRPFNRFSIEMEQAGILLDKEHHADNSEISMMTLVISACAALGHTWDNANKMYLALYSLTMNGIKPIAELLNKDNSPEFEKEVTELIVKSLGNSSKSKDGIIYNILGELIEKYKNRELITDSDIENNPIPFSDSVLFKKLLSMLSSLLTSTAIKMKFKGILSVLVPSHEIMKLYGGKLRSDFVNPDEEILELLNQVQEVGISDVRIGRTYHIYRDGNLIDTVLVQAPSLEKGVYGDPNTKYFSYYELQKNYADCSFVEDITVGRNLGAYFCSFVGTLDDNTLAKFNFYDLVDSYNLYNNIGDADLNRKQLQETLKNLKEGGTVLVMIKDVPTTIQISNLNIDPYEVIMPKTMADKLGLSEEDCLSYLVEHPDAFKEKFVKNLATKISDSRAYTVALKRLNGKHLYILDKKNLNTNILTKLEIYNPITENGETWRVDSKGNKLYKMASSKDEIYTIEGLEVIVTDNVNYYISESLYNMAYISDSASTLEFYDIYKLDYRNPGFIAWKNAVNLSDSVSERDRVNKVRERNRKLNSIYIEDGLYKSNGEIIDGAFLDQINKLGNQLYSSFKKSLDIIAARIPAQSMQSFMPMKVVGYESLDINTAYVSTHQIWLQGSDYTLLSL